MLNEEIKAFFHEPIDFQKVSRYENGYSIFDVQFGTIVLLDG